MHDVSGGRPGRLSGVRLVVAAVVAIAFGVVWPAARQVAADGTETLGPLTIPTAEGTGVVIAGTGLFVQPASFDVVVPTDAVVEQVILYWESGHVEGDLSGELSDETLTVNGVEVRGLHAGGPTVFFTRNGQDVITSTHRVDITSLGFVGPGTSTLTIDDLDTDEIDDGAGVVVVYRQGNVLNDVLLLDGNDIAFAGFPPPRDTTVPQTFTFAADPEERVAELGLIATSTHTTDEPDPPPRPSALLYTVDGATTRINDPFPDTEGREFDSTIVPVTIPAGATELVVQLISDDNGTQDLPASLVWMVATLVVPLQQVGSLKVAKAIEAGVEPTTEFTIGVDCSDDAFDQSLTLVGGGEVLVEAVPVGTTCTLSEQVPEGFADPVFAPSDVVTIAEAGQMVEVTVTNAVETGTLVVRKVVTGAPPPVTFEVQVDCSGDLFDRTLTLRAGEDETIAGLPVGTTCTISETQRFGFERPVFSPSASATITDAGRVVELTVINERIPRVLPPSGLNETISLTAAAVIALGLFLLATTRGRRGRATRPDTRR